jgi:hypothetical protein
MRLFRYILDFLNFLNLRDFRTATNAWDKNFRNDCNYLSPPITVRSENCSCSQSLCRDIEHPPTRYCRGQHHHQIHELMMDLSSN